MTSTSNQVASKMLAIRLREMLAIRLRDSLTRDLIAIWGISLLVRILTALPMQHPGYMDAYYYVDGAWSLYEGRGFSDPFIWNYLDRPQGIPHPSHLYWMPLSSILAYLSFLFLGPTYRAAQVPFVLLSSIVPVLSYLVAGGGLYGLARNRRRAWCAGLFATFSGFYMAYWVTPDNFAPFAVAGALCLLALGQGLRAGAVRPRAIWFSIAGLGAGFAHLSRSDGALLLVVALLVGGWQIACNQGLPSKSQATKGCTANRRQPRVSAQHAICYLLFAICYLLVMGPWFVRNFWAIGRPLPASALQTAWLTDYDDLYSYGKELSFKSYLDWGWGNIVRAKLQGLWLNLQTLLFAGWMIAMAPLGLIGAWRLRRCIALVPAWLYGLLLYLAMSLAFTLPGVRGAMLHSSAALLPFLTAAAMEGLDALVEWVSDRRKSWDARQARHVLSVGWVVIVVALSAFLYMRALPHHRGTHWYASLAHWMQESVAPGERAPGERARGERVLINDPATFYYYSRRECLAVPNGEIETLLYVARRYNAYYLVLDRNVPSPLRPLYERPGEDARVQPLGHFADHDGQAVYVYWIGR